MDGTSVYTSCQTSSVSGHTLSFIRRCGRSTPKHLSKPFTCLQTPKCQFRASAELESTSLALSSHSTSHYLIIAYNGQEGYGRPGGTSSKKSDHVCLVKRILCIFTRWDGWTRLSPGFGLVSVRTHAIPTIRQGPASYAIKTRNPGITCSTSAMLAGTCGNISARPRVILQVLWIYSA